MSTTYGATGLGQSAVSTRRVFNFFMTYWCAFQEQRKRQRLIANLCDLSDRELMDIGTTRGEIDYGLPNHYYLLNFKKTEMKFPVAQTFFAPGDPGNLVNCAGAGILATGQNRAAAEAFVRFLLSTTAQQYFASEVSEYPVIDGIITNAHLLPREEMLRIAAPVTLDDLDDLDGTLALLRTVGLL